MHCILLTSSPNTGLHFLRAFFKSFAQVTNEVELDDIASSPLQFKTPSTAGFDPKTTNLIYGQVHEGNLSYIENLSQWYPCIVPVRDPLASLITQKQRSPNSSAAWILDRWKLIVTSFPENVKYAVLDTPGAGEKDWRLHTLAVVASYVEVLWSHNTEGVMNTWANTWPMLKFNSQGVYPAKLALWEGDLDYIKVFLGDDYKILEDAREWLKPFLEAVGYEKLIWWS